MLELLVMVTTEVTVMAQEVVVVVEEQVEQVIMVVLTTGEVGLGEHMILLVRLLGMQVAAVVVAFAVMQNLE
jgi:hypothetical protein